MNTSFRLFPDSASSLADEVDGLYFFLVGVGLFFTALICVLILFFAVRYRRGSKADRTTGPHRGHLGLEIFWSVVPLVLVLVMFGWGAVLFFRMMTPPAEAPEVYVVGRQWMWKFQHPEGKREINELHVPVGEAVRLKMISEDVIHSFFVPDFRVKMDVLPGRYSSAWFRPTKTGRYRLYCAEYCGTSHSEMIGWIVVQSPAEHARWLAGERGESAAEAGRRLFEQFGCSNCHRSVAESRCPPLEGLFGRPVPLEGGGVVRVDEAYIRESILNPQARVHAGYPPVMPTFEGQINEDQILQIIAYLKSMSEEGARDEER